MALTTRCIGCRALTRGSYCPACRNGRDDWRGRRKISSGWEWGKVGDAVHARDRACRRCGSAQDLEVHHVIPLAEAGTNHLSNLVLLCSDCHGASRR